MSFQPISALTPTKRFCHPSREEIHSEFWQLPMTQITKASKHLLLIDCEEDRRHVTQIGLELMTNWTIRVAHSYSEGFKLAKKEKPNAILVNFVPLDAKPLEILKQLLEHPATQHIPIILTVDRLRCVDRQHFNQLGVAGTIAQPYDCVNLGEQIASFLNWHGDR